MDVVVRYVGPADWRISSLSDGALSLSTLDEAIDVADRWMLHAPGSRIVLIGPDGIPMVAGDEFPFGDPEPPVNLNGRHPS